MINDENISIEEQYIEKSNTLLRSKLNASLLENQIMTIALNRIQIKKENSEYVLKAQLYPGELGRLVSDKAHIYRDLKKLSKSIVGHTVFIEDGNGNFKAFSVVPNASYEDGVFTIEFNKEIRNHILYLKENRIPHASLAMTIMISFKSNAAFRIYELLKKDLYKIGQKRNKDSITVTYNLCEFRFIIGVANADNIHVKKYTDNVDVIDWEKAYKILEEKGGKNDIKYRDVNKLKTNCIDIAQKELEEKSDLRFDYKCEYVGRKYGKIIFTIYKNTPKIDDVTGIIEKQQYAESISQKYRQMEIPMDVNKEIYDKYVGHNNLSKTDIDLLLFKAGGEGVKVARAIEMADEASKRTLIRNYIGWIIDCIENNYEDQQPVLEGSAEMGDTVQNIINNYDVEKVGKKAWEKTKSLNEFSRFLDALYLQGVDVEQLEILYDYNYKELVKLYTNYRKTGEIKLE